MSKRIGEVRLVGLAVLPVAMLSVGAGALNAADATAREILEAAGVKGGLLVHVGCGDGKLTAALGAGDSFLVHGLSADPAEVEKAREHIRSLGLYGKVSVESWTPGRLPYADNLVSLLVLEDAGKVAEDEVMRVLAPRGVAYVRAGNRWEKTVKPWPKEMDEWTHFLHDATGNAVAKDTRVGPPRRMQWVAGPLYGRSHEIDTTVCALISAGGRVFYILDEGLTGITDERLPQKWALVARDAFSGVQLWKRPVPHWGWPEWKKQELAGKDWTALRGQRTRSPIVLPRRLVAEGDRVYVTLGYRAPLTALDGATGEVVRTYEGTNGTDEITCSGGVLVLCVRKFGAAEEPAAKVPARKAPRRRATRPMPPAFVLAVEADSGRALWRTPPGPLMPMSLAVCGGRVFFHDQEAIVAVDAGTGKQLWRAPARGRANIFGTGQTLVARAGVVLLLDTGKLRAFSAETGKLLWTGRGGRRAAANPPDLFVADGLVWPGGSTDGYDPLTGEVRRTIDMPKCLITVGHHFRCYRGKATDRYILHPKRGVEFMDLRGEDHMKHDWLRAACRLGVMPANGLLYVPCHQCFCYPGVKLSGFNALAPSSAKAAQGRPRPPRLEKGPAYAAVPQSALRLRSGRAIRNRSDWPTFRHDAKRRGSTPSAVPAQVQRLWQVKLAGRVTQPVVAGGKVLVASVDSHTVHALSATDGKPLWSYTAGGRVDSPPTVHDGLVLFGSRDGSVYCLRASDGKLAWRFGAGPQDRRVVAFGQLESAWPVSGSVLVKDGIAYFAAGRSSYLDGGIHVYGLDPATGRKLHEARVEGPYPDVTQDAGRPFDMEGAFSDVLVTDGELLYMQQTVLDGRLKQRAAPRITKMGDRKFGRHVFATGGFLDGSGWNRTFWMYSARWPGFYIANQSPKAGQLLVVGETSTYAVKCFTRRNRHSPMFFPGREGYLLFADDNDTEPALVDASGKPKPVKWLPGVNKAIGWRLDSPAVDKDKGTGFTRPVPPQWAQWVPVRIRAMVLAGKTLFVAGPPDVLDPEDPLAAFEGRKGALLWAVSPADGRRLAEYKLDSPPVFDGLIAAGGRLYMARRDGTVACWGAKQAP